jgi:hypothetical protein
MTSPSRTALPGNEIRPALPGHEVRPALPGHEVVVDLRRLRPQLVRGGRVFAETIAVPTLLLYVMLRTAGLAWGLAVVIGWCCTGASASGWSPARSAAACSAC